jgi:1-acyl-sn-glycerol-3-phosphate acyltransferase
MRRGSFVTPRLLIFAWFFFGIALVALVRLTVVFTFLRGRRGRSSTWACHLVMRHASILDTLLPSVYVRGLTQWRVRYILKQELLLDPCLDIVGNALPNYFVDRTGHRQREFEGIRALVKDLGDDGVLVYPEGTRFSEEKLVRAQTRDLLSGNLKVSMLK